MELYQSGYRAYLLRLSPAGPPDIWRVTLYCAQTGERWRFANLEQLYAFLCEAGADAPVWVDPADRPVSSDQVEE